MKKKNLLRNEMANTCQNWRQRYIWKYTYFEKSITCQNREKPGKFRFKKNILGGGVQETNKKKKKENTWGKKKAT